MEIAVWIVAVLALASLYAWYAAIVARRNRVGEALSGIDVQLNQRHDLLPNLLAIARRFMEHERGLLEEVARLRAEASAGPRAAAADPAALGGRFAAEARLEAGLGRLFAVAENYPALRADGPMIEAQEAYREVETNVAASRRFYNSAVTDLRNAVQIFPGPLLARLAGVSQLPPFFEAPAAARGPVDAAAHL